MTILILSGDPHSIQEHINPLRNQLNPNWSNFNFNRFDQQGLEQALLAARTPPIADEQRLTIVENCQLAQWGDSQLSILQDLPQIPPNSHLIFIATSLDRRKKPYKFLIKHGSFKEYPPLKPWDTQKIQQSIKKQARQLNLKLTSENITYLAQALGSDRALAWSELQKLQTYAKGSNLPISQTELEAIIPNQTQDSLKLADLIRKQEFSQATLMLEQLQQRGVLPIIIISTLITQFRTWLAVKAALKQGITSQKEIAQFSKVANPNQVFYLKQEVERVSLKFLAQVEIQFFAILTKIQAGRCHNPQQQLLQTILNLSNVTK